MLRASPSFLKCFIGSFLLSTFLALNAHAQQAETVTEPIRWQAKIESVKSEGSTIVDWQDQTLVESNSNINYADIHGKFSEKVYKATLNGKSLVVQEDGSFSIYLGFPGETKNFVVSAVDENHKVHRMEFQISAGEYADKQIQNILPHRWRFSAGGGITSLSYRQQRVTPFNQFAATVKGSVSYRLVPDKVDLGLSSFYNAFAFGTQSPKGYTIRYLGVNIRAGYSLISAPSKIRVNLNAGWYFNTSFSANIGFGNMMGPQLYPEFIYVFNNGHSLLLYGKFSPAISSGGTISFSDNREIAGGTHYSFPISSTNRLSIGVDVSQLKISVAPDWGCTNTYSLSAGISF